MVDLMTSPIIKIRNLTIGYKQKKQQFSVQTDLNLNVFQGELVCLIGPNGCGKSTLLRTLSGLQPSLEGEIRIKDLRLQEQALKDKSRLLSLVLTEKIEVANLRVFDLVSMGRSPYTNWLGYLSEKDKEIIHTALSQVNLTGYEDRMLDELSDGEKQRAMIAKALVQDTPVILLDEPTAHLDLPNRVAIMNLLYRLAKETNKAVILSTHELDLALQTSDKLWLMSKEYGVKVGTPEDLILTNDIQTVFADHSFYFDGMTGNFIMKHSGTNKTLSFNSTHKGIKEFWTERALKRNGYHLSDTAPVKIILEESGESWTVITSDYTIQVNSIENLLQELQKLSS